VPTLFEDRFEGNTLSDAWHCRAVTYDEVAAPASECAVVDNGLTLSVKKRGDSYLNGHISTQGAFEFTYCWVAARIKFQPYHGSHGCVWLAPTTGYEVGQSEVDIAECFGAHDPTRKSGVSIKHSVYWREPDQGYEEFSGARGITPMDASYFRKYHTYKVRWSAIGYEFYVDGNLSYSTIAGRSEKPKYLVLSNLTKAFEVQNMHHPIDTYKMHVKWIKVWR